MNLSEKFKKLRETKSMSVYKLSKLSDVSENYIHSIEKGNNRPSFTILEKLFSCLGVTIAEFFNESEDVIYPTAFEREFIETIRLLDEEKATTLFHLAKMLAK